MKEEPRGRLRLFSSGAVPGDGADVQHIICPALELFPYPRAFSLSALVRCPMLAREMVATHPIVKGNLGDPLIRCVEECFNCAQTCTSCADACLAEQMVADLRQCIRLNLDCADMCVAAGKLASRRTGSNQEVLRQALDACMAACGACKDECQRHAAQYDHCRICAEECARCEQACRDAMQSVH
jgi:hypothetical protein